MTTATKLMTADELLALPDDDLRHELLDGVLTSMSPTGWTHGKVVARFAYTLIAFVDAHDLGLVLTGDVGVILRRNPDRVRAPDICFIARGRLPDEVPPSGYGELIPDFVVEVVSPNDRVAKVRAKIEEWLRAGVKLAWAVYPKSSSVVARREDGPSKRYGKQDTIDAEPVLPGFSVRVAELFQ
ncbi:MAG: Uma2 family endonuclease [Dehalococcoidia bacterium]